MKTSKKSPAKKQSAKATAAATKRSVVTPRSLADKVAHDDILRKSKPEHAVELCWALFETMQKKLGAAMRRKDAVEAAMAKGVAYYTARTQYQHWFSAGKSAK